jgi:hypothetical protein
MTTLRTVAVHDIVATAFPRETKESDLVAMAIGKAFDSTLNHVSHESRTRRTPTATAVRAFGDSALREALDEAGVEISGPDREAVLAQLRAAAELFRTSVLLGLPRPRSRLIVIGEEVGVYAQPDFWNGRDKFYELKSYLAVPLHPDVALQVRLFQLAFPGFEANLVSLDRHAKPVTITVTPLPPPSPADATEALRLALDVARASGQDRVLEYVDAPVVRYPRPDGGVAAPG